VAEHTIVNLKQVEDSAPGFGFAPDLEARFAGPALELESAGISYQRLAPNYRLPFGHRHEEQEELYVVLSGSGRLKLDEEIAELKARDAVRIPAQTMRCIEAGPDGLELLAFGAPHMGGPPGDVAEMTPNWWTD
jgi:mannose-6-phosphate isomerase-like protein (cupin superfamily)